MGSFINNNSVHDLRICSFNCRSVKNCLPVISNLCDKHDIVLLQEHWLLPNELNLLNLINKDFVSYGQSAVDISVDILVGRPYGGTAILFRKNLSDKISKFDTSDSRITGLILNLDIGPMILLNVYMPTNYGDIDSMNLYVEYLCKLHSIITDSDAAHILVAGDFNCCTGSRFYEEFSDFVDNNCLTISDMTRLQNAYTYVSDDGLRQTWIDHILSSVSVDNLISDLVVLDEVIVSDHKPISFMLLNALYRNNASSPSTSSQKTYIPLWQECNTNDYLIMLNVSTNCYLRLTYLLIFFMDMILRLILITSRILLVSFTMKSLSVYMPLPLKPFQLEKRAVMITRCLAGILLLVKSMS